MEELKAFFDSPAGLAIYGALAAAFLDFAFGVYAAVRDGVFAFDSVAAFLRKHILGRVLPAATLAITGHLTGSQPMIVAAAAALSLYAAETLASIYASLKVPDRDPATAIPQD